MEKELVSLDMRNGFTYIGKTKATMPLNLNGVLDLEDWIMLKTSALTPHTQRSPRHQDRQISINYTDEVLRRYSILLQNARSHLPTTINLRETINYQRINK